MHTPAYRRLYVHVLCTYELCSSAKLPSSLAGHWHCALAVGFARDAAQETTHVRFFSTVMLRPGCGGKFKAHSIRIRGDLMWEARWIGRHLRLWPLSSPAIGA